MFENRMLHEVTVILHYTMMHIFTNVFFKCIEENTCQSCLKQNAF